MRRLGFLLKGERGGANEEDCLLFVEQRTLQQSLNHPDEHLHFLVA